jgi:hypothetical protein
LIVLATLVAIVVATRFAAGAQAAVNPQAIALVRCVDGNADVVVVRACLIRVRAAKQVVNAPAIAGCWQTDGTVACLSRYFPPGTRALGGTSDGAATEPPTRIAPSLATRAFLTCTASPDVTRANVLGCLRSIGYAGTRQQLVSVERCRAYEGSTRIACVNAAFAGFALAPAPEPATEPPPETPPPTIPPTASAVAIEPPAPPPTPIPAPTAVVSAPTPLPEATAAMSTPLSKPTATQALSPKPHAVRTRPPQPLVAATSTVPAPPRPTPARTTAPRRTQIAAVPTPRHSPRSSQPASPRPKRDRNEVRPPPAVAVVAAIAALASGAALVPILRVRSRNRRADRNDSHPATLTIDGPRDGSIVVAGRPVTFTAHTSPPDCAHLIRWSVTTRPDAFGSGPSFTYTWSATGVEQVVARLDGGGPPCDVLVYVFKTQTGRATVRDLLESAPPPFARRVESFVRYGTTATGVLPS